MKVTLLLILICISCRSKIPIKESGITANDTQEKYDTLFNRGYQFECGTSELLRKQMIELGLTNPPNFKEISFLSTKSGFYQFLKLLEKDSSTLISFNKNELNNIEFPTSKDSIWFNMPMESKCYIKKGSFDSFPMKLTFTVEDTRHLKVLLAADSTIVNSLEKLISDNKLFKLVAAND